MKKGSIRIRFGTAPRFVMVFFLFANMLAFFSVTRLARADDEQTFPLNMLTAPQSPGFVLMDIAPTSVERPGDITDLTFLILNHDENMLRIPGNFAVEFAPYWHLAGKNIRYENYAKRQNLTASILQTLSVSVATSSGGESGPDSMEKKLALGVRFSLLTGEIDQEFDNYAKKLDSLYEGLAKITSEFAIRFQEQLENDPEIQTLNQQLATAPSEALPVIEAMFAQRENQIKKDIEENMKVKVTNIVSTLPFRRLGWKLDFAGGILTGFPAGEFDKGQAKRWGIWLTGGREWKKHSVLGVIRYMGDRSDNDYSSVDIGTRLIYDNAKLFSASFESIYRFFPNDESNKEQWRAALMLNYAIAKNKIISFTLGRDFEGRREGNVISILNLLLGFGSQRPIR